MSANWLRGRNKVEELFTSQMAENMSAILLQTGSKGKGCFTALMAKNTLENLMMVECMDREL